LNLYQCFGMVVINVLPVPYSSASSPYLAETLAIYIQIDITQFKQGD